MSWNIQAKLDMYEPPADYTTALKALIAAARESAEWHSAQGHRHITDVKLAEAVAVLDASNREPLSAITELLRDAATEETQPS